MRPKVFHIIYNLELFIASRALISQSKIIHIIHSAKLFIASRVVISWDLKLLISSIFFNYSYHLKPYAYDRAPFMSSTTLSSS